MELVRTRPGDTYNNAVTASEHWGGRQKVECRERDLRPLGERLLGRKGNMVGWKSWNATTVKLKSLHTSQVAHQARAYPGFLSMK